MKNNNIHIGANIRKLRKDMKLSQDDLCYLLKLESKSTVCGYEKGKWYPPLDHIIRMTEIFNVSIQDLILKKL